MLLDQAIADIDMLLIQYIYIRMFDGSIAAQQDNSNQTDPTLRPHCVRAEMQRPVRQASVSHVSGR